MTYPPIPKPVQAIRHPRAVNVGAPAEAVPKIPASKRVISHESLMCVKIETININKIQPS